MLTIILEKKELQDWLGSLNLILVRLKVHVRYSGHLSSSG